MEKNCLILFGDHGSDYSLIGKQIDDSVSSKDSPILNRIVLSHLRLQGIPSIHDNHVINLSHLTLSFNKIASLMPLSNMVALKCLDVSHNKLVSLEGIPNNLQTLRCNNNEIESLKPISALSKLSELVVSNNKLGWMEYGNIIGLSQLQVLIKYGNPSEEKLKLHEFILSISPTLQSSDGVACQRDGQSDGFLLSTDGRQMLNQLRPNLTIEQRKALTILRENSSSSSNSSSNNGISTSKSISMRAHREQTGASGDTHALRLRQDNSIDGATTTDTASSPRSGKPDDQLEPPLQAPTDTTPNGKDPHRSKNKSLPKKFVASRIPSGAANSDGSTVATTAETLQATKVVRFGDAEESPVALCIYVDGSGYARWSKGGPVACSIENGRLFASFHSGSIACILDPSGAGSVMDSRGRCLLLLSDQHKAKVLNKNGTVAVEYDKQTTCRDVAINSTIDSPAPANTSSDRITSPSKSGDSIGNDQSGTPLGRPVGGAASGNSSALHRWKSDGMQIDFIPKTWELRIRIQSSRLLSEFSSVNGIRVVKEFESEEKKKIAAQQNRHAVSSAAAIEQLTDSEHESLRTGLASIMSGLDEVMANIKKS